MMQFASNGEIKIFDDERKEDEKKNQSSSGKLQTPNDNSNKLNLKVLKFEFCTNIGD